MVATFWRRSLEGSNSDPFVVLSTMMGEYLRTLVV